MGRIHKIKKDLIMEANKKLLGEDISDEIDKKISYINYLNTKYEQIGDTIVEIYKDTEALTKKLIDSLEKDLERISIFTSKVNFFCKATKSFKKEIEENLLHKSSKILDLVYVLEKINEETSTSIVPSNTSIVPSNTSIVPSNTSIVPSEDDEYTDYEIVPNEFSYDYEVAEDYAKRIKKALLLVTNVIKKKLNKSHNDDIPPKARICTEDMLSPIEEKEKALENLSNYLKIRENEVNRIIDRVYYKKSGRDLDPETGQQLDKIIKLLNFKKDERLETYLKDLVKGYDKTDNNDINK